MKWGFRIGRSILFSLICYKKFSPIFEASANSHVQWCLTPSVLGVNIHYLRSKYILHSFFVSDSNCIVECGITGETYNIDLRSILNEEFSDIRVSFPECIM